LPILIFEASVVEGQDRQDRETERHRVALMRLLAILFVYAGLADDTGSAADSGRASRAMEASREAWTLPRRLCRRLLLLLRPVEAATRRLIVVLASGLPTHCCPRTPGDATGARRRRCADPDAGRRRTNRSAWRRQDF
jgi:hypothetical protein